MWWAGSFRRGASSSVNRLHKQALPQAIQPRATPFTSSVTRACRPFPLLASTEQNVARILTSHLRSFPIATFTSAAAAASVHTSAAGCSSVKPPLLSLTKDEEERLQFLYDGVRAGDRRALAKAITLIESTHPRHRDLANLLLMRLLQQGQSVIQELDLKDPAARSLLSDANPMAMMQMMANSSSASTSSASASAPAANASANNAAPRRAKNKLRIGISGTPGVGKSSFIETFGMFLVEELKLKVAVLSIDPSSHISGGSILGDKTRMEKLSNHPLAYVRPSPTRGTLGGVAQDTLEAVILCESAGYDIVLIETVGVGQSEVMVSQTVDMVLLLVAPAGGDELQGIKKGIMELADLLIVNKADGPLLPVARRTKTDYQHALHLVQAHKGGLDIPDVSNLEEGEQPLVEWQPTAMLSSTVENPRKHMSNIWNKVLEFEAVMTQPFPRSVMATLHSPANSSLKKHASVSPSSSVSSSSSSSSPSSASSPASIAAHVRALCGDPTSVTDLVLQQHRLQRELEGEEKSGGSASSPSSSSAADSVDSSAAVSRRASCMLAARRALQRQKWMWHQLNEELLSRIRRFPLLGTAIEFIERDLALDFITPRIAAEQVLNVWLRSQTQKKDQ